MSINGIYDTGLVRVEANSQGQAAYTDAYGVETRFGAMGSHLFKHSLLDLNYRGAFRHYDRKTYYDGFDNHLMLSFMHQLSARTEFTVSETGSRTTRGFGFPFGNFLPGGMGGYDPMYSGIASNDIFDVPTLASITSASLVHQQTARFSYGIGGSGFVARRSSNHLVGMQGFSGGGNAGYRLSRYQTVAIAYSYSRYSFQRSYGQSDLQGVSVDYSVRLGPRWELALLGGGYRVESQRLILVQLDPLVAQILGQTTGAEAFHSVRYAPRFSGHLSRSFRRSTASISYDRTVTPGNGIYLTSGYDRASGGFSYSGFRKLSLDVSTSANRYRAFTQNLGTYWSYWGSAGFGYKVARSFSIVAHADARRYNIASSIYNHVIYRGVLGVAWSPGDYPVALW